MANPFDPRTVLFAKHAQHVVLVHFPIALFLTGAACDVASHWTRHKQLATVARFNIILAALTAIPVVATGIIAWRWLFPDEPLRGILLLHLAFGLTTAALIGVAAWLQRPASPERQYRFVFEALAALCLVLTAHLGGVLSGVNAT